MFGFLKHILIAACLLVALSLVFLLRSTLQEYERRQGLYWYDTTRSYEYDFAPESTVRAEVLVEAGGFRWPAGVGHCGTSVLRVAIASSWSGRWFEPEVRISTPGGAPFTQHFERGARGARYLNLSPLCRAGLAAGDRVELELRHLEVEPGPSELLLFENPTLEGNSLLVIAPHPDDAEIAAFGLYRAHDSTIVTITVGDYPSTKYRHLVSDPGEASDFLARLRVWDSISIPLWGGVTPERSLNLGYRGGALAEMAANPTSEAALDRGGSRSVRELRRSNVSPLLPIDANSTWESLVSDLSVILDRSQPAFIAAPHPVLDGSSDHRLSTVALLEALERVGDVRARLLLYNNHHLSSEYWPFGPASSLVTLAPWFGDRKPASFGSLFSFSLDDEAQRDKLVALEAMHDLRGPPRAELGDPTLRMLRRARREIREFWADPHLYYSYYRRGPRPNELFFVVAPEERALLREAALEALGS